VADRVIAHEANHSRFCDGFKDFGFRDVYKGEYWCQVGHNRPQTEVETMLRSALGESFDGEMHNMRVGVSHLRSIDGGDKALGEFAALISGLGPLAEVRGIRFLAEIGQMVKHTTRNGG
jgi:hypothetical protein